jgi:hypothetical protein
MGKGGEGNGSARTLRDKLAMYLGAGLPIRLGQDDHPFSDIFPTKLLQCKRRGLAGRGCKNTYPFSLDRSDAGGGELAE